MNARNMIPHLPDMPERLAASALVNGEEAAWEQADCAAVIEWLRQASYAVLGFELWLSKEGGITTFINTLSDRVFYCASCDPHKDESWDDYVQRSARLATEGIAAFRWPEDSIEGPDIAYFNLTWANREWFQARKEYMGS